MSRHCCKKMDWWIDMGNVVFRDEDKRPLIGMVDEFDTYLDGASADHFHINYCPSCGKHYTKEKGLNENK